MNRSIERYRSRKMKDIRHFLPEWTSQGYRDVRRLRLRTGNPGEFGKLLNTQMARYFRFGALRSPQQPRGQRTRSFLWRGTFGKAAKSLLNRGYLDSNSYMSFTTKRHIAEKFSSGMEHSGGERVRKELNPMNLWLPITWIPAGTPWAWFDSVRSNRFDPKDTRGKNTIKTYMGGEHEVVLPPGRIIVFVHGIHRGILLAGTQNHGILNLTRVIDKIPHLTPKHTVHLARKRIGARDGVEFTCSPCTDFAQLAKDFLKALSTLQFPVSKKMIIVPAQGVDIDLVDFIVALARCTGMLRSRMDNVAPTSKLRANGSNTYLTYFVPDTEATSMNTTKTKIIASLHPKRNRNNTEPLPRYAQLWQLFEGANAKRAAMKRQRPE